MPRIIDFTGVLVARNVAVARNYDTYIPQAELTRARSWHALNKLLHYLRQNIHAQPA